MPNRYPAQQEKVPRRRHAPEALPGGTTGGGGGRGLVVLWRLGLGAGDAGIGLILSLHPIHFGINLFKTLKYMSVCLSHMGQFNVKIAIASRRGNPFRRQVGRNFIQAETEDTR
jgi:hypothetical protein